MITGKCVIVNRYASGFHYDDEYHDSVELYV